MRIRPTFHELTQEALASPLKRSRQILVPGFDMIICLHRDSRVGMHRHPRYEAYHIIEGKMNLHLKDEVRRFDTLSRVVCLMPMTWHEPRAETKFVIYREFFCGPFDKARDVEYFA